MKINRIFAAVIVAAAVMCTGCDQAKNTATNNAVNTQKEVTAADKKAYVESTYSTYFKNDLRAMLPFSDMIGLPLADLKTAVDASEKWAVETSVSAVHVDNHEIAYSFSNRAFHLQDSDAETLLDYFLGGAVNYISVKLDPADYVDVVTDDTSKQSVQEVYILKKNSGLDFETMKKALEENYILDDSSTDKRLVISGLIAEPDYQAIYDYEHHLTTTKPVNTGLGCMTFNMSSDTVIFGIKCNITWN